LFTTQDTTPQHGVKDQGWCGTEKGATHAALTNFLQELRLVA
jgi:hypothetical protein